MADTSPMNDPHGDMRRLMNDFLDGVASDDQVVRLEELLVADDAAREEYLQLADLHACLAVDETLWAGESGEVTLSRQAHDAVSATRWSILPRSPLPAAVVGVLVGLLGAGLTFGYVVPQLPSLRARQVLLEDGFESGPPPRTRGLGSTAGVWDGDFSTVVGPERGMAPRSGRRMLRLLRADYDGKPERGQTSYVADLWRLVDLRPYRAELAAGATVRLSAAFNATAFPASEAYCVSLGIHALDAATAERLEPADASSLTDASIVMTHTGGKPLDRDPRTWQAEGCELHLPADAEYLLLLVGIAHGTAAQRRIDLPGHCIDDVKLTLETRGQPVP